MSMTTLRRAFALAATLLLAACATHKLAYHDVEPGGTGRQIRSVMVVAVTYDKVLRRVYEDAMSAKLATRGLRGAVTYDLLPGSRVEEAVLREAVAKAGVDAVLITREGSIDRTKSKVSGGTVAVGTGSVGMYGWYSGTWSATEFAPTDLRGAAWSRTTSRLFDARDGALLWTGAIESSLERDKGLQMDRFVDLLFKGMLGDKVI
jgi:hypothetical protein